MRRAWILVAAASIVLLAACGPPAPRRRPLAAALPPVTIAGETRPAMTLGPAGVDLQVPDASPGSVLAYAVGVRPQLPRGRNKMIVAHNALAPPSPAPAPAPAAPRPRAGPTVKGRYVVEVRAGEPAHHEIGPGRPSWIEHRVPLPRGSSTVHVSLEVLEAGPEGEAAFLADATLLAPGDDRRPSVVLISIDSLRADHLGAYGHPRPSSPHMDRISRRAELFTEAHSTTCWTLPAHVSMLASRYGSEVSAIHPLSSPDRSVPALAEVLRALGYYTWARVNHLLVSERFGFDRGFAVMRKVQGGTAESTVDEALAAVDAHPGEPLFLFLHLFDVHYDYTPPPPWDRLAEDGYTGSLDGHMGRLLPYFKGTPLPPGGREHLRALYDGEIGLADREVGRLLDGLARRRPRRGTLVIVTSDHGEEFQEHGSLGHGLTLYDEQLRIPLLLRDGARVGLASAPVSLLDVAPTVTSWLGMPRPAQWRGAGLHAAERPARGLLLAENRLFEQDLTAVVSGRRKVLLDVKAGGRAVEIDLDADPRELAPRDARPDLVPHARWLRHAFLPGIHRLSPDAPRGEGEDARAGLDPETGLWHLYDGESGDAPGPSVPPSGVRSRSEQAARDGAPVRLRVEEGATAVPSPEELETLQQLGYVQ